MRLFIAIELTPEIQNALARIQEVFKRGPSKVKWVDSKNIHLTLRFLGETPEEKLEKLKGTLEALAGKFSPFELSLNSPGAFPKIQSPRIIWVGVNKGRTETSEIAEKLEEAIAPLGFEREERAFHPHLTLGRVKFIKDKSRLIRTLKSPSLKVQAHMTAPGISLMQSTLMPEGPIYTTLSNHNFK